MKDIGDLNVFKEKSEYVFVNVDKIYSFLRKFDDFNYKYWLSDIDIFATEKEAIIFSFICESLNFCFWGCTDWKIYYKGKNYQGSEALFYSLLKAIDDKKMIIDIDKLHEISESDFNSIFSFNGKTPSLMSERYSLFFRTINVIKSKKEKFFDELFSIKNDLDMVEYIICNFEHFNDESMYKGRKIHFNKRAILLVNDLYNLSPTIRSNLKSINNLTGCADYSIPRIFLTVGIFEYSDDLLNIICSKKMIEHNSQMEIEIRGNTLYVIELMIEYLNDKGININSVQLDNIIWKMRKKIKCDIPVHMTECIYY